VSRRLCRVIGRRPPCLSSRSPGVTA
jgi:hypothetical protein